MVMVLLVVGTHQKIAIVLILTALVAVVIWILAAPTKTAVMQGNARQESGLTRALTQMYYNFFSESWF